MGNVVPTAELTADAIKQANISVGGDAAMTGGAQSVTTGATQTGANNVAHATGQVDPGKALTQGASPAGTAFNQDVMARANSWGPASNTTNPTGLIGSNTGTLAAEAGLNNLTTGNLAQNALGGAGVTDWSSAINAGIGAPKAGGGFMDWLAGTDSATKAMLMQGVGGAASALSGYMSKEKELETLERLKKDEQKRTSVKVGGIRISDNALRKNTQLGAY
jgi:hypothetical protein